MSRPRKLSDAFKLPESINLFNSTEKDSHPLSRKNSDPSRTRGTRARAGSISKADIVHAEAGRVKDGFTQFVESQACQEELSAAKKPSSFERPTRSRPEEHKKAAKEFYEYCADLLPSPAGSGHPMRPCRSDEDVGKKKLEAHEKALTRSNTTVALVRTPSQTRPLNVPTRKRSLSIDSILRAPAPPLFSRSKRNRAPAAAPAAPEAPRGRGSTRTVVQTPIRPPPPPLHRSASTDPVAPRPQVLRVPEHRRRTEPEPPAAPKVSQSWYRPAKPVGPPQAPADCDRVLRCDERRSFDSVPSNANRERTQAHQRGNSAQDLQQYATRRGSHDSAPRPVERPGSRTDARPHMRQDEERVIKRERLERVTNQARSDGPSHGSSRQHDAPQVQAGRRADVKQPEQSGPVLGESTQRRRRQESVSGERLREPRASQHAHANQTKPMDPNGSLRRTDSYVRPQVRGDKDIGQREPAPQARPRLHRKASVEDELSRRAQLKKLEDARRVQSSQRTSITKELMPHKSTSQDPLHTRITKAHSRKGSSSSEMSIDSVSSGSFYSQPSAVDSSRQSRRLCASPELVVETSKHVRLEPSRSSSLDVSATVDQPRLEEQQPRSRMVRSLPPNVPPKAVQQVQPTSRTSQDAIMTVRRDKPQPPLPKEPVVQKRPSQIVQKTPTGSSWSREPKPKHSGESITSTISTNESIASGNSTLVSETVHPEPAEAALGFNMLLEVHYIKPDLSKPYPSTRSPQLSRSLSHDTVASPSISHQAQKQLPSTGSHVRRASEPDSLRQAIQRKESDELPPKPHPLVWLERSYRGICPTAEAAQNPSGPADSRLVESKPALGTVKQKRFSPFIMRV